MKVLLTGATGFVGSHVAREVAGLGHQLRVLVRDPGKAERVLGHLGALSPTDVVVGDMTDLAAVARAVEGCDAVIHAAGEIGVEAGGGQARTANIEGVRLVIGAAVDAGIDPIIYTSTVTVHLPTDAPILTPDSPMANSESDYAASKRDAELHIREWQKGGAPIASFVIGGVYGPESPHLDGSFVAITGALEAAMIIPPGGLGVVDVRDLATMIVRALQPGRGARRYMAGGTYISWEDWTDELARAAGVDIARHRVSAEEMIELGRKFDAHRASSGESTPLSEEAAVIMVSGVPTDDSATHAELGVSWRPVGETFADTVAYLRRIGRLAPAGP